MIKQFHVACVVQAVTPSLDGEGEPTAVTTTLSDESGKYQFSDLEQGKYQVRCYTLNGYIYYDSRATVLQVESGRTLSNINLLS